MSRRIVLLWLLLAVGLAIATLAVVLPGGAGGVERRRLLSFEPSGIESVVVEAPGRPAQSLRRERGVWVIAQGDEPPWPANEALVSPGLRLLATVEGEERASSGGEFTFTMSIRLDTGEEWRVACSAAPIGGDIAARVTAPDGRASEVMIPSDLYEMFFRTGLSAWRDARLFPGVSAEVSRITLEAGGERVGLGRTAGRWTVREPWTAPADEHAVANLVRILAGVPVTRFVTGGERASADAALATPLAVIRVESDRRELVSGEVRWYTHWREVAVGGAADLSDRNVYARVRGEAGRTDVVVPLEALASIAREAGMYTSRMAVSVPDTEWGEVHVIAGRWGVLVERRLDGWGVRSGEEWKPLSGGGRAAFDALVTLLARKPADVVTGATPIAAGKALGKDEYEIRILGVGSTPIEVVYANIEDEAAVVITGSVRRRYDGGAEAVRAIRHVTAP